MDLGHVHFIGFVDLGHFNFREDSEIGKTTVNTKYCSKVGVGGWPRPGKGNIGKGLGWMGGWPKLKCNGKAMVRQCTHRRAQVQVRGRVPHAFTLDPKLMRV